MLSSWAESNHNHSVLCQTSTFGPIHLPHWRQNVTGRKATWVPWPHPCWTVALLKIKTLLLGIYHNTMARVMWYTRECATWQAVRPNGSPL